MAGPINKIVNYTFRLSGADGMQRAMSTLAATAGNLAVVGIGATTAALAALSVQSIATASELQEIKNQFDVVFGESAVVAQMELNRFADTIGRSGDRMMAFAATIQDTLVPLGMARGLAGELSLEVVKLATDLSSFKNIGLEETINRISYGLVGQHRSVQRLGIVIRQTTLNQELLNMGIEGGYEASTEAEKALARMNLMFAASRDAMGDAVRTADAFENQVRILEDAWYDFKIQIGDDLIPVLEDFINKHLDDILKLLPKLAGQITTTVEAAIWLADTFVSIATANARLQESLGLVGDVLHETADLITAVINPAVYMRDKIYDVVAANGAATESTRLYIVELILEKAALYEAAEAAERLAIKQAMLDTQSEQTEAVRTKILELYRAEKEEMVRLQNAGGAGSAREIENLIKTNELTDELKIDLKEIWLIKSDINKLAEDNIKNLINEKQYIEEANMMMIDTTSQSVDIMISGFEKGFGNVTDQFKSMLVKMAADFVKSQLIGSLFSLGKKGLGVWL